MLHLIVVSALLGTVTFVNGEMMAGGKQNQDPRNPVFMNIAWKAAKTLNEDSAANFGLYAMMPIKVLKAQSQVVAGLIYDLEVLYGESDCKKNEVDLARMQMAGCRAMSTGNKALYKIRYYARPWQNYEQISVSKVQNNAMMAGGRQYQDPNKPEYMEIAWKAAKTLNEDPIANPGTYAMMPIRVLKAQSQVVSGVLYYLDVLYGESGCKKQEVDLSKLSMANCKVMNRSNKAIYKIEYYVIPWRNYEAIRVTKMQ
ncbi:unnamed protein product [Cylicocyclus nassatus]|uniref:Cystatin domain-containing protein n=1 Tax=Cylicocyclus nassatus TaxID=53992 RepID=A0AA36GH68_CYLNA|nr:unnamed protein product [Cylicocyclus nassatus]